MPESFARGGVEGQEAVAEEIAAVAIASPEIEGGRSRGQVDDATGVIDGKAAPGVGAPHVFPGVFRPGVVPELAGPGDGPEGPADLARADVVGAYVSRGRRSGTLADAGSEDEEVSKDDAR